MPVKKSFKKGWDQLQKSQIAEAQKECIKIFNLQHVTSLYRRINGTAGEPTYSQGLALEAMFRKKFGIRDIWD